jgi:hypothetical protein
MPMLVGKRVWAALSDVRRQPICRRGFLQLEVGVRVSGVTCCHPMSLAVDPRREVC